jgi:hypothetical protein
MTVWEHRPPVTFRMRALGAALFLASLSARAQSAPPEATKPMPGALRVGVESGAGLLGGAILGGAAAWTLYSALGSSQTVSEDSRRTAAQVGAAVGMSVGAPIGVSLAGKLLNRRGSFIVSWLSSVAGLGVGYGIYGLARSGSDSSLAKGTYALTLLLPVAGAVLGYELSSPSDADLHAEAGQLVPALALSPRGAAIGLSGRF